ncbi:hypothetical protein GCM10010833_13550 [Blastomonas aquatica]|uniref:Rap1a immunity protein domain-containing protein n=2 Tax=Blastomonas aquatica TaxID=1510276 RepID=A0ABQ1J7N4_9SPHN|nr:hypothetical protein GCM10010833_13550 [Blastomonas aquatica]
MRVGILATAAFLSVAATSEMTTGQFLAAMDKAESLGPAALMSSDVRDLRAESDRVLTLYRADIARQAKTGGPRHSCPPPKGEGKMKGEELKIYLTGLPAAKKKQPFRTALYDFMKQKYPCK